MHANPKFGGHPLRGSTIVRARSTSLVILSRRSSLDRHRCTVEPATVVPKYSNWSTTSISTPFSVSPSAMVLLPVPASGSFNTIALHFAGFHVFQHGGLTEEAHRAPQGVGDACNRLVVVGFDGLEDLADAVRGVLSEDPDHLAEHLSVAFEPVEDVFLAG